MDNPCVICEELRLGVVHYSKYVGCHSCDTDEHKANFYNAQAEERRHKRICNVHRVWIGGRG